MYHGTIIWFILLLNGFKFTSTSFNPFYSEVYLSGRKYSGHFKNNHYHSQGTDTYPDIKIIRGEFREGHPWGKKVKMILPNGDVLEDNFEKGHAEGKGKYSSADGSSYVGEFHKGHPHGFGTEYSPEGKVIFSGQWHRGEEVLEPAENSGKDQSWKKQVDKKTSR